MKLLMTTDTVGGVWTYAIELARSLRGCGVEIALATMGDPLSPGQRRQVEALPHVTVFESRYKLEWMQDPWSDLDAAGRWLLEVESKVHPNIVHLNGYVHAALPWRAPVVSVAHSCVLSWWEAVKGEPAPAAEWDHYHHAVADGIQAATVVVAPSRAMLDSVERHYGTIRAARVIYNGRDPHAFAPGDKQPFILSAGRLWDEAKNLAALDHAARDLSWPVCVAGQDASPDGSGVVAMHAKPLGTLDESDLAQRMSHASIYALPARYEPFGLSILEAAMSGCALVLGDIPSLRELWSDAAEFVPPGDTTALLQTLQRLIDEAPRRAEFAFRAKHRAARYTSARMADAYLALYQEIARPTLASVHAPDFALTAAQPFAG